MPIGPIGLSPTTTKPPTITIALITIITITTNHTNINSVIINVQKTLALL